MGRAYFALVHGLQRKDDPSAPLAPFLKLPPPDVALKSEASPRNTPIGGLAPPGQKRAEVRCTALLPWARIADGDFFYVSAALIAPVFTALGNRRTHTYACLNRIRMST
jgi:hypothetical protein